MTETHVLDAMVAPKPPEALAILARVRRYFTSRFAMWDSTSSDEELFAFSLARECYPHELTVNDLQSLKVACKTWTERGQLPEHVLLWYQTSLDDLMHLSR